MRQQSRRLLVLAVLTGVALAGGPPAVSTAQTVTPTPYVPAPPRAPGAVPPLERPFLVADGVVRRTLAYGPAGLQQTVDVFTPAHGPLPPRPTVLLIHGGGWQIGDSTEWQDEAVALVRARGWNAVSLNYRLAPDARWPAQRDDAVGALALLHRRAVELGVDRARIGAIGDSAGGHLAALLGEPGHGRHALRAVVTWSGLNDLAGLTLQPSAGGCGTTPGCAPRGLAARVVRDLMGCAPASCAAAYRRASPAAGVGAGHAATLAFVGEAEQVDPRQAWVMDAALARNRVPSRVHVLPGTRHARGYQAQAWPRSLRFLAATLTPEIAPEYPRPRVRVTLDAPASARVGAPVRLSGAVRPGQAGSTVSLQVRDGGTWRTVRLAPLQRAAGGSTYAVSWTPRSRGTTAWRTVWRGSGAVAATPAQLVVAR